MQADYSALSDDSTARLTIFENERRTLSQNLLLTQKRVAALENELRFERERKALVSDSSEMEARCAHLENELLVYKKVADELRAGSRREREKAQAEISDLQERCSDLTAQLERLV